jgi:Holliday junction resolvase RusA-like endonuclease
VVGKNKGEEMSERRIVLKGRPQALKYNKSKGRLYVPQEVKKWQQDLGYIYKEQYKKIENRKRIMLKVFAYIKGTDKQILAGKGVARIPDLSNIIKAVENALEGVAYNNDNQISGIIAQRILVPSEEDERIEIEIN